MFSQNNDFISFKTSEQNRVLLANLLKTKVYENSIFGNTFLINTKVLIPCEISTMTNKQTLALFYFHIPNFWDVTDYHP